MKPTLHMNGTAPRDLYRECREAMDKLSDALEAVQRMTVNGRDYYPQGPDAITQAKREHLARLNAIAKARDEIMELAMYIQAEAPSTGSLSLEAA